MLQGLGFLGSGFCLKSVSLLVFSGRLSMRTGPNIEGCIMGVRKTDSEFGGRGGVHPPAEFVPEITQLESWEQASLMRRTDGAVHVPGAEDTEEMARAEREKRARKNDVVGK